MEEGMVGPVVEEEEVVAADVAEEDAEGVVSIPISLGECTVSTNLFPTQEVKSIGMIPQNVTR
jgi:hypothetical protein